MGMESINKQLHFYTKLAIRIEMSTSIAPESFDEIVDAFWNIGGSKVATDGRGILHETQILIGTGLEMIYPRGVLFSELVE